MEQVVQLQRTLLGAVCRSETQPDAVTADWAAAQVPDADEDWLRTFLAKERKGKTPLDFMREVAGAADTVKQQILEVCDDHLGFERLFDRADDAPLMNRLNSIGNITPVEAAKSFLERFYDPAFYGEIAVPGGATTVSRTAFMGACRDANDDQRVCPLCDGYLDAELDHFYPKAHYPALSCHPVNLVPICHTCNKPGNKGEKTPLSPGTPDPAANWFHPYLDAGYGDITVTIQAGAVTVTSADPRVSRKLENLDRLIKLNKRWSGELRNLYKSAQFRIRNKRRLEHAGRPLPESSLTDYLRSLRLDAEATRGVDPFSILAEAYYERALTPGTEVHTGLCAYGCG